MHKLRSIILCPLPSADASSILRTESLSKSLHRSCQKGKLPYRTHVSLTLCHLVFNLLQFHQQKPSVITVQKCFRSSGQRCYSYQRWQKNLHVPWPTNRKLEESNKSIEPLHNTVWGSKSSQQEKLLLNAAIKLSPRYVSNGNCVCYFCQNKWQILRKQHLWSCT